jgi:tRNA dimethylallyltransferase
MTVGAGNGNPRALPSDLPALIVAGPTCSGKSALALALAERLGGDIINADSMQIYRELRIVTARPSPADEARVPHALYGVRAAAEAGSAAWWCAEALAAMARARAAGRLPILCGGTGLYFSALTQGLADIPHPGAEARAQARALLADIGPAALHARLAAADPATAAGLYPSDGQRLARAWEVLTGTGKGLAAWQAEAMPAPAAGAFRAIMIAPPRDELRAAIAGRFAAMVAAGAVAEVEALLALKLDPALPAMRAHGVPELGAYLRGEITLEEAERRACLVTGQYTKRQATWFRHRRITPLTQTYTIVARISTPQQFSDSQMAAMQNFILGPVDASQHDA